MGTTPLDFTMNPFHLFDSGNEVIDPNFTLAVLQQAETPPAWSRPATTP